MPRDGWTARTIKEVRVHEFRRNGEIVASVSRVTWKTLSPWSVWLGLTSLRAIGSASTVREGKALAEATLAREGE